MRNSCPALPLKKGGVERKPTIVWVKPKNPLTTKNNNNRML
jgi:hypothetical protein